VRIARTRLKVEANSGKPQIAYKETILSPADGEGKLVKQSGGRGQYGHVVVKITPNERGKGITIENKVVGGAIPKEFIPPVIKGLNEAVLNGVVGGYPVIDSTLTSWTAATTTWTRMNSPLKWRPSLPSRTA